MSQYRLQQSDEKLQMLPSGRHELEPPTPLLPPTPPE
jgi:hypothetical protein